MTSIHALVAPFQSDIGAWIERQLAAKLAEVSEKIDKAGTPDKRRSAEQDRDRYHRQRDGLRSMRRFTYGIGPDYGKGQIGHADILKMVPHMLMTQPLLVKVVASRFPIIFVDESQDTESEVVKSLTHLYRTVQGDFLLGFFGDTMQQIYATGIGRIPAEPDWTPINKPENFRSSRQVLEVVNRVRAAGDGDQQIPGRADELTPEGHAYFFVLPTDADRATSMHAVRRWLAQRTSNDAWTSDAPGGAKILVAMHKLAARRLGFADLHAAFHVPKAPAALSAGFDEGTAWPIAPFLNVILPLCEASAAAIPRILRKHSTTLRDGITEPGIARQRLTAASEAVRGLQKIVAKAGAGSVGDALRHTYKHGLIEATPLLSRYLDPAGEHRDQVLGEKTQEILEKFMACDIRELYGYLQYIRRESPYSTQHGTKGAEFPNVIVLLDDSEGTLPAHSYDKLLGLAELSDTDRRNKASGKDTTVDRSRRLLYVCVSRAQNELAIVLYATDVDAAILSLKAAGLADQPLTADDLSAT